MAKEKGINVKVYIGDADPALVLNALSGEKESSFNGDASQIDTSDKTNAGWRTYIAGLKDGTVTFSGQCDWGDTAFEALRAQWEAGTTLEHYIRFNVAGDGFRAPMQCTLLNITGAAEDVTTFSGTLVMASAPTAVSAVPIEVA